MEDNYWRKSYKDKKKTLKKKWDEDQKDDKNKITPNSKKIAKQKCKITKSKILENFHKTGLRDILLKKSRKSDRRTELLDSLIITDENVESCRMEIEKKFI